MNNHKKPLVCIIVVNWNGERIIGDCLKYLTKTTYKNYKIIVIDNNSEDGSHKIISKFKNVEIVKLKENVGSAPGFNRGWNYCLEKYSPKYICDISNDVMTPQKEWLSIMVDALEKNSSAGICSNFETFPRDYKDKE